MCVWKYKLKPPPLLLLLSFLTFVYWALDFGLTLVTDLCVLKVFSVFVFLDCFVCH